MVKRRGGSTSPGRTPEFFMVVTDAETDLFFNLASAHAETRVVKTGHVLKDKN